MNMLKRVIHHVAHGVAHLEQPFHMTYLGAAFHEAHGLYSQAAGALFIVVAIHYVGELVEVIGGNA